MKNTTVNWKIIKFTLPFVADPEPKVQDNPNKKAAPTEERRQGTEPSRRFLMDLNTGMLKEHVSEMNRRVSGFYNYPSNFQFRQGTENSHRTLVDIRTGIELNHLSEMERRATPYYEFKQGTEYSPVKLVELRRAQMMRDKEGADVSKDETAAKDIALKAVPPELRRQGTEPSRRFLMDLNTGMLKEHVSEMNRRVSGFYNYPSNFQFRQGTENSHRTLVDSRTGIELTQLSEMERRATPYYEFRQGTEYSPVKLVELRRAQMMRDKEGADVSKDETAAKDIALKAVPPELRRQGTEPSRRFLMDLNTGMLKEHVSEMNRRVSGFYNYPSNFQFRQGTENSHRTLVDIRTGIELTQLSEMERRATPYYEFRQGTEYSPVKLVELRRAQMMRDKEGAEVSKDETAAKDTTSKAVPPELRRQGTEPSRRFLMDLNTGMLKEHVSEMNRRVSGFYNYPSNLQFRQGTENSHRTLVDSRTGIELTHLSEMERRATPYYEFRQGTEYSPVKLVELRRAQMMRDKEGADVSEDETAAKDTSFKAVQPQLLRQGTEPSRVSSYQQELVTFCVSVFFFKAKEVTTCQGEVIDGKCYNFNPDLLTFSEAEASCKQLSPLGHLASITSADLHAHLVAMVTRTKSDLVLTWLGAIMKNNVFEWTDGSSWGYSDWMPGHPRTLERKQLCVEIFRMGKCFNESWWTAVDCGLKRASICSYPVAA
ncbi:hypothetical protein NFI96_027543 [Prochilodus magdalenae]|nr:hypothetical protein NFI96_027543 [Prochilodus magdalenae]